MKQNFYSHVHPIGCGHEFLELGRIKAVAEKNNTTIIVTPHVEEYNPKFIHTDLYSKMLDELDELSKKNPLIIKGAEFTLQTMLDLPKEYVNSFKIKILSFHDRYKFNGYILNEDNTVNVEETLRKRGSCEWIYSNKYTAKQLLGITTKIVEKYNIDIIGHLERFIEDMLIDPTDYEIETLYNGMLEIAKNNNICIEVNLANQDKEKLQRLIDDCIKLDLKIVVGFDAHYMSDIKARTSRYNYLLDSIECSNQVSLQELLEINRNRK